MEGRLLIWLIRGLFSLIFYILFGIFQVIRALVRLVAGKINATRVSDDGPGATAPVPARSTTARAERLARSTRAC